MSDKIEVESKWKLRKGLEGPYQEQQVTVTARRPTTILEVVGNRRQYLLTEEDLFRYYYPVNPTPSEPRCHCGACWWDGDYWVYRSADGEELCMFGGPHERRAQVICPISGCNTVLLEGGKICQVVSVRRMWDALTVEGLSRDSIEAVVLVGVPLIGDKEADPC